MKAVYVGLMPGGQIIPGGETAQDAVRAVRSTGFDGGVMAEAVPAEAPAARSNPATLEADRRMIEQAVKRSGLRKIDRDQVLSISLSEAVDRLYPIFTKLSRSGTRPPKWVSSRSPAVYAAELMGDNAKLVKATDQTPLYARSLRTNESADLIGLNLFPADKLKKTLPRKYPKHPLSLLVRAAEKGPDGNFPADVLPHQRENLARALGNPYFTLCTGSSSYCRASCLVFTGKNVVGTTPEEELEAGPQGSSNDWKKAGLALALLADPEAYLRLLVESVRKSAESARKNNRILFIRMNLLSDVPWEEIIPWFFRWLAKDYPEVMVYDYTKISGRNRERVPGQKDAYRPVHPNYDLTFSFNGANAQNVTRALYDYNQRVAVVFLGYKLKGEDVQAFSKRTGEYSAQTSYASAKKYKRIRSGDKAIYGWGLPQATDIFAPPELKGTSEAFRPVVSGDMHDARPLDPPNTQFLRTHEGMVSGVSSGTACITGLIWKTPIGYDPETEADLVQFAARRKAKGRTARELRADTAFVVKAYWIPAPKSKVAEHRGTFAVTRPGELEGFLIVPETPRQEGLGAIAATGTFGVSR